MKSRLPQGFGGGGGSNMNDMIKQAQKMQENMEIAKQQLEEKEFSVTVGGGAVEVVASGKKEIKQLNIKPDVVDPDDVEMLQDLIISAVNEVIRKIEDASSTEMDKVTGGLSIPGIL